MKNKLKTILILVVFLLFLSPVYGQDRTGTIVSAPVTVGSSANTFPSAYQDEIHGGYKVVANIAERDAITPGRRVIGMPCYVIDEGKTYRLDGGILNGNWQEVSTVLAETDPVVGDVTGLIKANGLGNISAAVAGTDYQAAGNYLTSYTETDSVVGDISGLIKADGLGSISAAVAGTDYQAAGNYLTSYTETDPKVGSLTQNYISKWGPSALTDSLIYDDGTSVGIGVVGPGYKLDVDGDVNIPSGKKYKINGNDLSALDVPYDNSDYPTVAEALDSLLYVAPAITSFNISPSQSEIGSTVSPELTWTTNNVVLTSQTINGVEVTSPYTAPATSATTAYTLVITDGQTTATASRTISFLHSRYWGVSEKTELNSVDINGFSHELSTTRGQTRSMSPGAGQYIYIVYPADWDIGLPPISFAVGGLASTDWVLTQQTHTNASTGSALYNVYRKTTLAVGTFAVVVN